MLKINTKNKKNLYHFIVDDNNLLAFEVASKLAKCEKIEYNPIHFLGAAGVGKTHLIKSIFAGMKKNDKKVGYISAKKFFHEYVFAIKNGEYQNFRSQYRDQEVLIIEDIDFLRNKNSTQKELLFLLNEFLNTNNLVITSSEIHPRQIPGIMPALLSRISCGLFIPVGHVSKDTLKQYFHKMAQRLNLSLSPEILEVFSESSNILSGKFVEKIEKLFIFCTQNNEKITPKLLQQYLKTKKSIYITKKIIIDTVSHHYKINPDEILSKRNTRIFKEPRYIAIALIKELLDISNLEIQEYFGLSSESSIRYAVKTAKQEQQLSIYNDIYQELSRHYSLK